MKTRFLILVAALFAPMALAQNYTVNVASQPYQPLVGGTSIVGFGAGQLPTESDDDEVVLPLGFSFPYYGQTYTQVLVSSNGVLTFDTVGCGSASGCNSGLGIPSVSRTPHLVLAPWWDDYDFFESSAPDVQVKSSATEFEIEYRNMAPYFDFSGSSYEITFRVKLTAAGVIQYAYGPRSAGAIGGSATVGWEDATGAQGGAIIFPPATTACSATTAGCSVSSAWPQDTLVTIGQPVQPDLIVQTVNLNSVTVNGGNLTLDIAPLFRNFGQNPTAAPFFWKAYLSLNNRTLETGTDTLLLTTSGADGLMVAGGATVTQSKQATIPLPAAGNYYVIVEVDTSNAVDEGTAGGESNNVGATTNYFVQGLDLVTTSVSGPAASGPGNMMTLDLRYFNQGTTAVSGTMAYEVRLSADSVYSTSDYLLYSGTRTVSGGQTVADMITLTVPANVPGGEFFYILRLDPANVVTETNENNNTIASTGKVNVRQADLVIKSVDFVDAATGVSTRRGLFGQPGKLRVVAANEGGADARNFKVGVVISQDASISLLSDSLIVEVDVPVILQGQTITIDVPFTPPLNNAGGMPFTTGNYFFFGLLDSRGDITELNDFNNNLIVATPVLMSSPAPDLTVVRFDAPSTVGVGEIAPVYRVFKNLGNVDAPEVKYRYFISANAAITTDDTLLPIVTGTGTNLDFGSVTLAIGQVAVATEYVQLPSGLTPGTYYIGAVIDSERAVVELDETNNGLGSAALQVAPSSLRVATSALPDAISGRPYSFGLAVQGDAPNMPTTWAVDTAQGALPAGLTLSASGLLSGTPTVETVSAFTVVATNNGRSAVGRLALRVLPTTTQVEITTPSLPSLVNSTQVQYETYLAAAGGVKPYSWRLVSGTLPRGIALLGDGKLSGVPGTGLMEVPSVITVEVRDALGTTSQRTFNLRVVAPGSIVFQNLSIPDGLVGVNYVTDISVKNFDMTPLAKPLVWRTVQGALPDGLSLTFEQDVAILQGTPLVAGTFAFTLEVEDAKGRNDSADFLLRVYPARLKVSSNQMPTQLKPGDTVDFSFVVAGSTTASFQLFSGALPPGTAMGADGKVTGTVDLDKSEGTYNFVVEGTDATGASGLGAFTLSVKRAATAGGCSTTPGSLGLWLLVGLLPLAFRRRSLRGIAVAALVAVPFAAHAQYAVNGPTPATYTALPNGTSVGVGATVPIPFPFQFYGATLSAVEFSQYGYLTTATDDADSVNQVIPHNVTSAPPMLIAPWWDALYSTGAIQRYQVFGVAPNRYIAFEWSNFAATSGTATSRMSFEAILYEGTNTIRFAYGPAAPGTSSSSIGIQKQNSTGTSGLSCTPSCNTANWPPSQIIDFALPPDLTIASVSVDQVGYAGVTYRANALVNNLGGLPVTNNSVRFYLSTNATYESSDLVIGDSLPLTTFPASSQTLVTSTAPIPAAATPGAYFVLSQVNPDPTGTNEPMTALANNWGAPTPITIGAPTADLVVTAVTGANMAMPGQTLMLGRTLSNVGNATAGAFKYTWFISDNSVVSLSDTQLGAALMVSDLTAGQSDTRTDMVALPASLPAGQWWIGVCVNYDPQATPQFGITEISQVNNCNQASQPIVVSSGALSIITAATLPPATQYSPYGVRLQAAGGNGSYSWAVASGSALPAGLTLTSPAGDLQGTLANAGTSTFEMEVSSGGTTLKQQFTLVVSPGNIPLAIVDQDLPAAEFGRAYAGTLIGVGGKPPYVWALKADARLPAGLALSTDGDIEGRASEVGTFTFSVELTDAMMNKASKNLAVRVVTPATMHIATSRIKTALLKQDYTQQLLAIGGRSPYTWSVLKFQQLPQNATEKPGEVGTKLPDDFGIHIEDGNLDYLRGEPKVAGQYAITFRVTDAASAEDFTTLLLTVSYNDPIAITTTALPDAFVAHDYSAKLSHNRGKESTGIAFTVPCVIQATSGDMFACATVDATQNLPAGLTLGPDGAITGVPTGTGDTDKSYSFLVKVVDDAGRQDIRSLSIRLRPNYTNTGGGGCTTAAAGPLLLALVALLRRRKVR